MPTPAISIVHSLSETSVGLAKYLLNHGKKGTEMRFSCPVYSIEERLKDARLAKVYLSDRDESRDPENMPQSELRIYVTPTLPSQFGFESVEIGLNGRWTEYVLRLEPPSGNGQTTPRYEYQNFIPMGANVSHLVNDHFQLRYRADTKKLLKELCEW